MIRQMVLQLPSLLLCKLPVSISIYVLRSIPLSLPVLMDFALNGKCLTLINNNITCQTLLQFNCISCAFFFNSDPSMVLYLSTSSHV